MWPFSHSVCELFVGERLEQEQRAQFVGQTPLTHRSASFLGLRQVAMHQHHGHRPFADGCCHSLGGLGTHVSCNKHTGHACFQVVRWPVERPAARRSFRSGPARMNPWSSRATTPSSHLVRGSAPMKKHIRPQSTVSAARRCACSRRIRPVRWSSSPTVSDHFGACADLDLVVLLDLLDQVVRHRRLQRRPAHEQRHRVRRRATCTSRPGRPSWRRPRCTRSRRAFLGVGHRRAE